MINLVCAECGAAFQKEMKEYKRCLTKHNQKNFWCSSKCRNKFQKNINGRYVNCEQCKKSFYRINADLKRSKHSFCSRSCAATFTNSRRVIDHTKTKYLPCIVCKLQTEVNIHVAEINTYCASCLEKRGRIKTEEKYDGGRVKYKAVKIIKNCKICSREMLAWKSSKYCEQCLPEIRREVSIKAGTASAAAQQKRSKNEIAFADKLQSLLSHEVLFNEPFFKDNKGTFWDADIIIPDLKLAIHWNGPWHYKQISKKSSLKQIQNRDSIKHKVIENNGFINYIIRDDGNFDLNKVQTEFDLFRAWLTIIKD